MVAFLEKSTGSEGFHQVINFLTRSHICYALTKKPDVCVSFIKQFWRSAEVTTAENGEVKITATIDGHSMTITEASLRRHLKLDDQDGLSSIPNSEIFEQLALMGYHTDSDKLTFQKGAFSPQWRFLIHSILHCLSPKKTAWEQFSSNIATAVICLATNRRYNFSRIIFEHLVSNISSPHKFLMYPRFIQICLDMQRNQLQQHSRTYLVPSLSVKVFNNMKRPTKGYSGQEVALFPTMLLVPEPSTSPSRITSSPSHSPEPSPSPTHSPSPKPSPTPEHITAAPTQPSPTQPSPGAEQEYHFLHPMTHLSILIRVLEADLMKTKKTYSSAYTKLILRVKKLEAQIKVGKARRQTRVVLSDTEVVKDDSSKQGRKFSDEGVHDDEGVHKKASTNTKIFSPLKYILVLLMEDCYLFKKEAEKIITTNIVCGQSIMIKRKNPRRSPRSELEQEKDTIEKQDVKEPATKRKKSIPRKTTRKRQKLEEDAEKDELKGFLDIVPREEAPIEVESISTKFPIVDWKTCVLTETFITYQVFRGDGSSKEL
ncbi:hypothetical protein Tco_0658122 [Tanacetum coccineum]